MEHNDNFNSVRSEKPRRERLTIATFSQTFTLQSSPEFRDPKLSSRKKLQYTQYEVFYEHQHLGRVERVVSGYTNDHWAYRSADGTINGKRGPVTEAIWELFDRVVRQPIQKAERKAVAARHYQPPVLLDDIPFTFQFKEDCSRYGGSALRYQITFPQDIQRTWQREETPTWEQGTYTDVYSYRGQNGQRDLWTASYYRGGVSRYDLEHFLPLELTLKWLFLHSEYLSVRCMRELDCFNHSIMRLIQAKEGLHSENTYRELLGFQPSIESAWKVYVQDDGHYKNGKFVEPKEHYRLFSKGTYLEAHGKFLDCLENDRHRGCILLLSPSNRLADKTYPSSQLHRTTHRWTSIFGPWEQYWRLTPWEQFLEEQKQEKMRKAMEDYAKSLIIDTSKKKPN
ncbi:MAG: hypothetical protein JOY62_19080 [Acidobacteriaceae bacterium]|nr:hypothetical protein [Acidobacteriaceae bacterium]MBV9782070.1 hypothetical protein [Acidobacteriaceae bacterium]